MNREIDVVDVHITSSKNIVDVFSQHPLLDGSRKYTVQVTEFVSGLAAQSPLPAQFKEDGTENIPFILEVRRKHGGVAIEHATTSLTTLEAPLGDPDRYAPLPHVYAPGSFTDGTVQFTSYDVQRPIETPGDICYYLQRMFDDIRGKYISSTPVGMALAKVAFDTQQTIVDDPGSSQQEIAAAQLLIDGDPNAAPPVQGLLDAYLAFSPFRGVDHGGWCRCHCYFRNTFCHCQSLAQFPSTIEPQPFFLYTSIL